MDFFGFSLPLCVATPFTHPPPPPPTPLQQHMEALEPAAFAELSGIDDSVSDAGSDAEVVVVPEDAAPAAEGDDGGEPEVDFDSMGLEELEARITEAEKSIEVEDQEQQEEEGN